MEICAKLKVYMIACSMRHCCVL